MALLIAPASRYTLTDAVALLLKFTERSKTDFSNSVKTLSIKMVITPHSTALYPTTKLCKACKHNNFLNSNMGSILDMVVNNKLSLLMEVTLSLNWETLLLRLLQPTWIVHTGSLRFSQAFAL